MSGVVPPLSITKEVLYINREFVNTMIDIYNELMHYPPFLVLERWTGRIMELS